MKKLHLTYSIVLEFDVISEDNDQINAISFSAIAETLKEAQEAIMDGGDTIPDHIAEVLPDDVELDTRTLAVRRSRLIGMGGVSEAKPDAE